MAISYVNASIQGAAGVNPFPIAAPAGIADGDSLWVLIMKGVAGTINSIPSGWSQYGPALTIGAQQFLVYQKIASGEPASWNWGLSGSATYHGQCIAFRGVDTANPVSTSNNQTNLSSTNVSHAALSPSHTNTMLFTLSGADSTTQITGTASGMTLALAGRQGSNSTHTAYQLLTASGNAGTRTHTMGSAAVNGGFIIALKPQAPIRTGTLAVTEAQDTAASSGSVSRGGTLAATEGQDGAEVYGYVGHVATLAVTEAQDVVAASGGRKDSGALAVTEAPDVARLWNKHNLVTYSEQLEHGVWSVAGEGLTVSVDVTVAPNGTMTAEKLSETATLDCHRRGYSIGPTAGQRRRFAFHAKAGERTFARTWSWGSDTDGNWDSTFDLITGATTNVVSNNPTMEALPDGWWRCSVDVPADAAAAVIFGPAPSNATGTGEYTGTAGYGIYAWGASLTYGTQVRDYDKTTDTPLDPLYGVVVAGAMSATEAQDTALLWNPHNLITYSEEIDNASGWNHWWSTVITANAATAPNGTVTAERLSEPSLTDYFFVGKYVLPIAGQEKRFSFYAEASGRTLARAWAWGGAGSGGQQTFDLSTGAASGDNSPAMESVGDGWWLCSFNISFDAEHFGFGPWNGDEGTRSGPYPGDGTSGINAWGAQLVYGTTNLPYAKTTDTPFGRYGVIRNGTLGATEGQDHFGGAGGGANSGVIAATEAQDVFAATGTRIGVHTGTLVVTEIADGLIAYAHTARQGTLAATEAQDTFAGAGGFARVGTLTAVETQDTAYLWNPHNLIAYSQEFDHGSWNKRDGLIVTANAGLAPDGTMTAEQVDWSAPAGDGYIWHSAPGKFFKDGITYTFSAWAKIVSGSPGIAFNAYWGGGVWTNVNSGYYAITSEWFRFVYTFTTSSPTVGGDTGIMVNNGSALLWGGQLVVGTDPLPYARTDGTTFPWLTGVVVAGTLTPTEAQDAAALSGSVTPNHYGTLAATEAQDTFAGVGLKIKIVVGTFTATEAQDALVFSGTITGIGTMSVVETQDVFAGVGSHTHLGTFAATEGQDVFAGTAQSVRVHGSLSVVEQQDAAALTGKTGHTGTMSAVETADAFLGNAYVFGVGGTLAATEQQDTFAGVGTAVGVSGTLVVTEAQDAFTGIGNAHGVRYGTLAVTEAPDVFYAAGYAFRESVGMPGAGVDAEGQQLEVTVGPALDLTAEAPQLDLSATAQALTGDAGFTPQTKLGVSWADLVINNLYSAIMPFNPMYRDTVDVTDMVTVNFGHVLFDSVQTLESVTLDRARTTAETIAVQDTFGLATVWVRRFSEEVTAQDAINVLALGRSIFSDSATLADLLHRAIALQKGDPVPVSDRASVGLIPRPNEAASVTDSLSRVVGYRRTFNDVAAVSEQMARNVGKAFAEPVAVADQKFGGWGKLLADNLFTADVQTRVLGKGLADGPTVTDASTVTVAFRRSLADTVIATDIFSSLTNDQVNFSDSVTMLDTVRRALAKPPFEPVALTDGTVRITGKAFADTVTLASAGTITGQGYANNYFAEDYVSGTLATFT